MSDQWTPQDPTAPRYDAGDGPDETRTGADPGPAEGSSRFTPPGYGVPEQGGSFTPPGLGGSYTAPGQGGSYTAPGQGGSYTAPGRAGSGHGDAGYPPPVPQAPPGPTYGGLSSAGAPPDLSAPPSYPARPAYGGGPAYPGAGYPAALVQQVGIVPLRPLDVSAMIGGSFKLLRFNPRGSIGVALICQLLGVLVIVPFLVFLFVQAGSSTTSEDVGAGLSGLANLGQIPASLITWVATLILCVVVSRAVIGEKVSIGAAWREAKGSFWRYVGLGLLWTVVAAAVAGLLILLVVSTDERALWLLLLLVPLGIWLGVRLGFASVVIVLERAKVLDSLSRSWALTRGQFWRIVGIKLLVGLLVSIIAGALMMPITMIAAIAVGATASGSDESLGIAMAIVIGIVVVLQLLASAVTTPVSVAVDTLLYVDQRIRREGLDVQLAQVVSQRMGEES